MSRAEKLLKDEVSSLEKKVSNLQEDILFITKQLNNSIDPEEKLKYQRKICEKETELSESRKDLQDVLMYLEITTNKFSKKLQKCLISLNYYHQKEYFQQYFQMGGKVGTFLIHSNNQTHASRRHRHCWLWYNIFMEEFIERLQPEVIHIQSDAESYENIILDLKQDDFSDIGPVEKELEIIAELLQKKLQYRPVIILIRDAIKILEAEEEIGFIQNIWSPLVELLEDKSLNFSLFIFMIEHEKLVHIDKFHPFLSEDIKEAVTQNKILVLPPIYKVKAQELENWIKADMGLEKQSVFAREQIKDSKIFYHQFEGMSYNEYIKDCVTHEELFSKICSAFNLCFKRNEYEWRVE